MNERPAPVSDDRRLVQPDVLRGLAVLGILAVNAATFAYPMDVQTAPDTGPAPFNAAARGLWLLVRVAFEGKFVALFSMLFGVSIYLVGGEFDDWDRGAVLLRRLAWLLFFGVLHGVLIWFGDILVLYALAGFVMFLCRSWRAPWLGVTGVLLFVWGSARLLEPGLALEAASPEAQAGFLQRFRPEAMEAAARAFQGSLVEVQAANFDYWSLLATDGVEYFGPITLGLMMLGLALFKAGFLQGRSSVRLYALAALLGAAALAAVAWQAMGEVRRGFPAVEAVGSGSVSNTFLAPVVTLGYVALISLALRSRLLGPVMRTLAPVGRMAFTNYIAQSVIMTAVFYGGRGLGLFGRLDWTAVALIVVAVWALQLVWSPLWLSRFTMGPLEWLWRRLSYGRPVPLRRALQRPPFPAA